jgi:hypothetical protein
VTQDGAGELGEEALDEIEPGAVFWREREVEAACRSRVEPGSGFPRDVCGMIVEDQLDRGAGRIGGIEKLEEFDELAAAVAIPDERGDLAGEQIDPGQQADAPHSSAALPIQCALNQAKDRELFHLRMGKSIRRNPWNKLYASVKKRIRAHAQYTYGFIHTAFK